MAFDVVTAKQGKPHVTADQQALMQAGMLGKGRYALDALNNLACAMTDSNTLTVDTGGLMVDGRWVVNEAQTSFAIANGSQAQFRKDLAVLEITVDPSTGVTSLEEKVLQGATAATEDAAADPAYEAGDLYTGLTAVVPIARITLNGLTPTCTALLPSVADLKTISEQTKKLGDSVSRVASAISVPTVYNLKVSGYGHRVDSSKATVFTLGGGLKVILFDVEIGWLKNITTGEYVYTAPVPFKIKEVVATVSSCEQWRFDRCRITLSSDKKVLNFVGNSDRATTSDGTNADNGYYIPFCGIMVVRV